MNCRWPLLLILLAAAPIPLSHLTKAAYGQDPGNWRADVEFEQSLNAQLPLDATFRDQDGHEVDLGDYFNEQPVILMPVYYRCPMLCGLELNGMVRCLRAMELEPGKDFQVVTFSFDPREKPKLAKQKQQNILAQYGKSQAQEGWHFLTGSQQNIDRVCEAIGFHAKFDEQTGQYAHAAGIIVCTPDGRAARYFYGVEFAPRDLRLGLVEASQNKIGSVADQVILYCYLYDPTRGKYGLVILNLIRAGGVITVVALAGGIYYMVRQERQRDNVAVTEGENRG